MNKINKILLMIFVGLFLAAQADLEAMDKESKAPETAFRDLPDFDNDECPSDSEGEEERYNSDDEEEDEAAQAAEDGGKDPHYVGLTESNRATALAGLAREVGKFSGKSPAEIRAALKKMEKAAQKAKKNCLRYLDPFNYSAGQIAVATGAGVFIAANVAYFGAPLAGKLIASGLCSGTAYVGGKILGAGYRLCCGKKKNA